MNPATAREEPPGSKPRGGRRPKPENRPLNPTADMLKLPRARYEPLYRAILARLDPRRVEAAVARLAAPHEPVLLCWERPPFSDAVWCHRRMVAEWLEETLGLAVPEIAGEAAPSTAIRV